MFGSRCVMSALVELYQYAGERSDNVFSRMGRADGSDSYAGAFHWAGMALRTKVRRHTPARIQAGRRSAAILAQPVYHVFGRVGLGALLVGYFEEEDFVFAGKVGTGFDTKLLLELRARLDAIEIPKSPFTKAVGLPRIRAHWVQPELLVQVAFIEWTVHGKLRHSRFLGIFNRRRLFARDVGREHGRGAASGSSGLSQSWRCRPAATLSRTSKTCLARLPGLCVRHGG